MVHSDERGMNTVGDSWTVVVGNVTGIYYMLMGHTLVLVLCYGRTSTSLELLNSLLNWISPISYIFRNSECRACSKASLRFFGLRVSTNIETSLERPQIKASKAHLTTGFIIITLSLVFFFNFMPGPTQKTLYRIVIDTYGL